VKPHHRKFILSHHQAFANLFSLEWIGLHRDRLPNLTHQIVIVTLLEVASEVEDAYGKILGSS